MCGMCEWAAPDPQGASQKRVLQSGNSSSLLDTEVHECLWKRWVDSNGHCVGQGAGEVTAALGKEEEEERKIPCRFLQTTDLGMLRCSGSNRITPPPLGLGKRQRP